MGGFCYLFYRIFVRVWNVFEVFRGIFCFFIVIIFYIFSCRFSKEVSFILVLGWVVVVFVVRGFILRFVVVKEGRD